MTTRAAFVWAIGFGVSLAALASGCHIEVDDHGGQFDDSMLDEQGVCPAFCQHVMNCGNIATDAFESCLTHCEQQRAVTPNTTMDGIHCVIEQSCSSVMGYDCPSAPFPGVSGGNAAGTCTADCDCRSGTACVEGICKMPCNASCECAEGETCAGGYCQVPAEPPVTCTVDCDCPSGNACINGICTPNG